jgi:hypothetical protein
MTTLNIWSFLIGMLALPVGWMLMVALAVCVRWALKAWALVATTVVHRASGGGNRNTIAGIVNSCDWASFIGGNKFGIILFRGYDAKVATEARNALDQHGPHSTFYKIKPVINPKLRKSDGGEPA